MVFSEQLSKFRKEANMTQDDLAEKCEFQDSCSSMHVKRYMGNKKKS